MRPVRIAAAGDVHAHETVRREVVAAFRGLEDRCDLVLLAGDMTRRGEPDEARVVAEAAAAISVPVVAVLGNHDWHENRRAEVVAALESGGVTVLDPGHFVLDVDGARVGVAGVKGFVGGFPGSHLPDFGEPLLRRLYAETSEEVEALDRALDAIAECDVRVALLHYSPTMATLEGEPEGIWSMLGSSRLAAPIARHRVDLVLHGHAHAGSFEGRLGSVPVYNVAMPVIQCEFWLFELDGAPAAPAAPAVSVEAVSARDG
jgi:Icc-related predicted phosphoesterase